MTKKRGQLELEIPAVSGWGGRRDGAGRKPRGEERGLPHHAREGVDGRSPVHVTLRARAHVWNLRTRRCFAVFAGALRGIAARENFRVVHWSVQGNHVHLIVETDDAEALASGLKSLSGRLAKGLNALMGRRGPVFSDRYHAHALTTPTEVANALRYVLGNFASHARRRGEPLRGGFVDPYSSAAKVAPDGAPPCTAKPRTWLLRSQVADRRDRSRI